MLRLAPQRVFHNPKRQRGIAITTRSVSEGSQSQPEASARDRNHNPKRQRGIALLTIRTVDLRRPGRPSGDKADH